MAVAFMKRTWGWYQSQMASHPLRTQIVMSGILWGTGDIIAQSITASTQKHNNDLEGYETSQNDKYRKYEMVKGNAIANLDWYRTATCAIFGIGFVGPFGHFWYNHLDSFVKGQLHLKPNSPRFILAKTIPDTLIFGPIHLITFFTLMGLAAGKPTRELKEDVKRDFILAFVTEGFSWPIIQALNFRFTPVKHQLLFVNSLSLFDSAFLSWFNKQGDAPWKKWLLSLISSESKPDDL